MAFLQPPKSQWHSTRFSASSLPSTDSQGQAIALDLGKLTFRLRYGASIITCGRVYDPRRLVAQMRSGRQLDDSEPRCATNAWSATGQRKGYAKPKLFSQLFQHGLTGLLGFGERLEG